MRYNRRQTTGPLGREEGVSVGHQGNY